VIRILHFADLHLGTENYGRIDPNTGLSSRLGDFLAAYDFIIDYALSHPIDVVVFAGDAFKNRDPSPTHQREFARRIGRLSKAGIPTFLLVGNHDLPNAMRRAHAIEIFSTLDIPNVMVAERPGYHRIETRNGVLQIVAVPWVTRGVLAAMLAQQGQENGASPEDQNRQMEALLGQMIEHYTGKVSDDEPALLVGHGTVAGAMYGAERNIMLGQDVVLDLSLLRNPKFDYVALGHIHKHQVLGTEPPIVYSGSPERIDFGEAEEVKGFVVAEVGDGATRWDFIQTPTRQFREVVIDVRDQDDPMPFVRNRLEALDVTDAIVKLIVKATPENEAHIDLREIRGYLKEANYIAAIVRDVERPKRLRLGTAQEIANATPRELLARYLEAKQVPPEQREKLLMRADGIFNDTE
jgi:exonuclease SbcD